ncbi:MAG: substrate-binding domain-containing protein [Fimbriiglobus sp.]
MHNFSRAFAVVVAAGALLFLPACGSGAGTGSGATAGGKPKIGVVTNCRAEFWDLCEAGANKAAKEFDVDLTFRQPDTMGVPDQMAIVEAFKKMGCTGMAVSVVDPKEQTPDLARIAKDVSLITMDNDADQTGRLCYVGIDNYEAGKAVGRMVKAALPDGGTLALFIGSTSSANGKARVGGVLDELAGEKDSRGKPGDHPEKPGVKGAIFGKYFVVQGEPLTDDGKSAKATDNAKDVLERLSGVKNLGMIGLYAYNPPAILEAARSKGLVGKIKVFGFDEDWDTLKGIANGEIVGTVVQDPFQYGYKSVEVLAAVARGDKSKLPKDMIAYRVVAKAAAPDETVNGVVVKTVAATDFEKQLRADLASVKK